MIVIADSGSTKCSWAICDSSGQIVDRCSTIGFNPYFITSTKVYKHLEDSDLKEIKDNITEVYFYGAGCSSKKMNAIIEKPFAEFFSKAEINVHHDLDAACYSMYEGKPAITGILGTGSNSCYFDGKNIIENAPSLGFLIGDEASGNYFGKKVLQLYFNKALPKQLNNNFESKFESNIHTINKNIYNNERANVYLAKFFPFITENKSHPIFKNIIFNALDEFFNLHICCYNKYKEHEVNFIGSVAYFLSEEINIIAKKHECKIGTIIKNPIKNLVNFHFNGKHNL